MSPETTPFQVASLVNSPMFPNSVVWSEDNLIAVATGDIVTIMNPEHPQSPRGVITLTPGNPFPVGVINKADLLSSCLLSACLSRDRQICVRSLSWSPVGFTSHNGCLLAVCSVEGRVKLYRQPYCEFQAEWIEVLDLSDTLNEYFAKINYMENEVPSSDVFDDFSGQKRTENYTDADKTNFTSRKQHKRKRNPEETDATRDDSLCGRHVVKALTESIVFSSKSMLEGSSVEVFKVDGVQNAWVSGRLQRLEGPMALVDVCEIDASGEPLWIRIDSSSDMHNQLNTADKDYSFPKIRPSMGIGHLPEQLFSTVCSDVDEILKVGQPLEAWSRDRWLQGVFMGCNKGDPLIKFSDTEVVAVIPSHVRLAPLWIAEEKSWKVTTVQLHVQESPEVVLERNSSRKENNQIQIVTDAKDGKKSSKRTSNYRTKHFLTAHQYASRSSMMASVVVAWSMQLQLSPTDSEKYCLLGSGTKSGSISIWRFGRPVSYSVESYDDPFNMTFVGVIQAHNAGVTSLSWGFLASDSSPQVLLASGCCDGSVRIWFANVDDLKTSSEIEQTPFSLLSEVTGNNFLVSALSLCVPAQSPQKILLAVGKGSGAFEVWTCNTKVNRLKKVGSYDAHVQAVTGLAWAFDGRCLYSCSQDNSMHGWIYHKGSLCQVFVPPNNLGTRSFSDLPSVSDSCYGVAISPGNLALAVARRFDAGQLDHMYQKRTQRAAIEFFWIGGQQVEFPSYMNLQPEVEGCSGFSDEELRYWGSKLLWSIKQSECLNKHLVVWDIVAALLAFKSPKFVTHIVLGWLELLLKDYLDPSSKDLLSFIPKYMSNITSRQLHLLDIFCRRVLVSSAFEVKGYTKRANLSKSYSEEEKQWMEIMSHSEKELRERFVGLSLSTVLADVPDRAAPAEFGLWIPVGVPQMMKWIKQNQDSVSLQLNLLVSEIEGLGPRLQNACDYNTEDELCSFCSAAVPFKSPETATCKGVNHSDREDTRRHTLTRCAVSMKVCPLTTLWFCMCCKRRASYFPPLQFFTMNNFPPDFPSFIKPAIANLLPTPLCPFCGISLQRLQPDFLLSISPV
ncbi:uncharacterized protein LOC130814504 isoform X2 [Amaranthus tricolor]|uniref:uncharacterized protein LOC130814504 isoform X2 n=1 Tax=Amaranthus tricolor TaxID=29722 RepID=UPI00258F0C7A|nr:uncharacterized protein LOC130814504 isoform X2 [Amaranthus tricolor]